MLIIFIKLCKLCITMHKYAIIQLKHRLKIILLIKFKGCRNSIKGIAFFRRKEILIVMQQIKAITKQ